MSDQNVSSLQIIFSGKFIRKNGELTDSRDIFIGKLDIHGIYFNGIGIKRGQGSFNFKLERVGSGSDRVIKIKPVAPHAIFFQSDFGISGGVAGQRDIF